MRFLRYDTCIYVKKKISQLEMEIEMESKNSGSYGDFDIFFLIVGHQEVKNFCKKTF